MQRKLIRFVSLLTHIIAKHTSELLPVHSSWNLTASHLISAPVAESLHVKFPLLHQLLGSSKDLKYSRRHRYRAGSEPVRALGTGALGAFDERNIGETLPMQSLQRCSKTEWKTNDQPTELKIFNNTNSGSPSGFFMNFHPFFRCMGSYLAERTPKGDISDIRIYLQYSVWRSRMCGTNVTWSTSSDVQKFTWSQIKFKTL